MKTYQRTAWVSMIALVCLGPLVNGARAQNYSITLYSGQNGTGNVVMTYSGPMLNPAQNGSLIYGFVTNPSAMPWNTPPISVDSQSGSLNPCNVTINNNGPNGEAVINCESAAPGTSNGVPLFSFCFQGVQWPMPVGTYNVDGPNFSSCGNYFVAYPQISGYGFAFAQLNSGSIVVALAQGGAWSTRAPMPTARWSTGIGVVNGIVYVMGGTTSVSSSGTDIAALEAYDPTSDTWSSKAPMHTPRNSFGVGVVSGIIYSIGGYSFECGCDVPQVEAYDPTTDTWSEKAPLPTPLDGVAVGVVNGLIYVVGGANHATTVQVYDPMNDTWSSKGPMTIGTYKPGAATIDGILYVVGGSGISGNLKALQAYDPVTGAWSIQGSMPTPRYYLGAGVLNELLYAVGGYDGSTAYSTVEAFDPAIQSWTEVTPMPTPRIPSVAVVNGTLYAIGGYDYVHGIPLPTVEAFTPTTPGAAELSGGNSFNGNQTISGNMSATSFFGNGSGLTGVNAQAATTAYSLNCTGCVSNTQLAVSYAAADGQGGNALNALKVGGLPASAFQLAGNYAPLVSPGFTGTPTAPTAAAGTNTTQLATTAYVNNPNNIYSGWHQADFIGTFQVTIDDQGKLVTARGTNVTLPASTPPLGWWVDVENGGPSSITVNPNGNNLDYLPSAVTLAPNQGLRIVSAGFGYFTHRGTGSSQSMTFTLSVPSLKPGTCSTSTFTFSGASDGDTTALGVPNALMVAGLISYSGWASAANTVSIRACDINPNGPATTAVSGTVRVDIWKH